MKKILYFVAALAATSFITTMGTSCKFAPDQHDAGIEQFIQCFLCQVYWFEV